jgi:hypothetical protein
MAFFSFTGSTSPEYYWQKPHYDLFNKLVHSNVYKTLNPIRIKYDYEPGRLTQLPVFLGKVPEVSWLYGHLDYTYSKYHRHYQAHDEWYPDRKNKSLGFKEGGFCDPSGRNPKYISLESRQHPRGCQREVRKYHNCKSDNPESECFNEKISIMEVCPEHSLQQMKERKRWYLRAKAIDNQTYRRAMTISDYNKGRSVTDLKLKDWSFGSSEKMRSDGYWADNRYDPTVVRHPHRRDTVNFPDLEYKDVFGGNWGYKEEEEKKQHALNFWTGKSRSMDEIDAKLAAHKNNKLGAKSSEGEKH